MVLERIKNISIAVLVLCVLVLCYTFGGILVIERKVALPFKILTPRDYRKAIDLLQNSYTKGHEPKTKEDYRKFVETDLGLHLYFYSEKNMADYAGKTYPLIRLIIIDTDADGYKYCETFVHEAIHLKEFIGQEDYVSFQTFKYLYESEELHNVGVWYGLCQIYGQYAGEYNVSHLIVDYLTNN